MATDRDPQRAAGDKRRAARRRQLIADQRKMIADSAALDGSIAARNNSIRACHEAGDTQLEIARLLAAEFPDLRGVSLSNIRWIVERGTPQ